MQTTEQPAATPPHCSAAEQRSARSLAGSDIAELVGARRVEKELQSVALCLPTRRTPTNGG